MSQGADSYGDDDDDNDNDDNNAAAAADNDDNDEGQQLDNGDWTTMIFTVVAMVIVALDRIVAVDVQASLLLLRVIVTIVKTASLPQSS